MGTVRTYCDDDLGCVRCTASEAEHAARLLWRALELGTDTVEGREALDLGIYVAQKVARLSEGIYQD
jgi:hypothetical protein